MKQVKWRESELIVSNLLSSLGIKNKLTSHHASFDIICENGLRIEVKRVYKEKKCYGVSFSEGMRKSGIKKYNGKYKKNDSVHRKVGNRYYKDYYLSCDFIICHNSFTGDFYIIPSIEIKDKPRISFFEKSKYNIFRNNFDLMMGVNKFKSG